MPRGIPNRKAAADDPADDGAQDGSVVEGIEPAEDPAPVPAPDPTPEPPEPGPVAPVDEPQPCSECFPDGWPAGATSVGCVHGQWDRATAGD